MKLNPSPLANQKRVRLPLSHVNGERGDNQSPRRVALFIILLIGLLLAGCGGLAGEPRIVASLPPSTAAPTEAPFPASVPDIAAGAQIFAQNCVRCHGAGGAGDGELVKSGQVPPPLSFADPKTSSTDTPVTWFNTITNGNIEHLMPPWKDALSTEQRWDVAMYVYTLAHSQAEIAHGRDLFAADCAQCAVNDFTDLAKMAALTQGDLVAQIGSMTQFASLSDADKAAVAAYARSLSVTNADAIGATAEAVQSPNATVEAPNATVEAPNGTEEVGPASVTISGQISNGTADSTVPAGMKLTLFTFDANLNQKQTTGSANPDGSYRFADVPFDAASTYVVTTSYRDRVFASDLLSGDTLKAEAADGTLNLPIAIYELTEDPDVIQISGLVTQVSAVGTSLQVAQVFNFTNTSDRAFTSSQTASNGDAISLVITLPPGAVVFPDNTNRYVVEADKFTVFDTVPVLPKEQHLVQIVYLIQYNDDAIIEQPLNYALDGQVRLLMNPITLNVLGDQFPPLGQETVGNTTYSSFGSSLKLASGDVLHYEVKGSGLSSAQNADRNAPVVSSNNLLVIIVAVIVVAILIGGGLFLIGSRNRSGDQQVINILVRQIAELDADHDAGRIDDTSYESQRGALKARLTTLMERKKK
ncbi:MAG: c-type cytochrome [Chloroflexi bacterium]|nr:c-type cytochrome [Chloroflexota bacterium]